MTFPRSAFKGGSTLLYFENDVFVLCKHTLHIEVASSYLFFFYLTVTGTQCSLCARQ